MEIPKPPTARLGILKPRGFEGSGGGRPASESDSEGEGESELSDIGFYLASFKTCISPSSSAVFPPSFAMVERPKPPIANLGKANDFGAGIGGGKPSSEELESWCLIPAALILDYRGDTFDFESEDSIIWFD